MRTSWNFQKSFNEFSYVLSYNTEKQKREYKIWYYVKLLAICSDNFGSHIIDKQNVIDENKNVRIYLWYLIQKKIYKFYSRIYDTIKFFVKFHKKSSNSQREINVFLHIFYAKWRKRLDERWISSECIKLNSKWLENIDTIQGSTNLEEFKPTAGEKAPRIYKIQGAVIEGISNEKFYGVLILLPVYNIQILIVGGGITYARDYTGNPLTWTTWKKYNYTVIK